MSERFTFRTRTFIQDLTSLLKFYVPTLKFYRRKFLTLCFSFILFPCLVGLTVGRLREVIKNSKVGPRRTKKVVPFATELRRSKDPGPPTLCCCVKNGTPRPSTLGSPREFPSSRRPRSTDPPRRSEDGLNPSRRSCWPTPGTRGAESLLVADAAHSRRTGRTQHGRVALSRSGAREPESLAPRPSEFSGVVVVPSFVASHSDLTPPAPAQFQV